jgi:trehalose 6-phosphate synthase/phosphatase
MIKKRLVIVANRLPVTVIPGKGVRECGGGLVSAMNSFLSNSEEHVSVSFEKVLWAGCPGCSADSWKAVARDLPDSNYEYVPVYVNTKQYDGYYNGFSNSALWPIFHYVPSYAEYNEDHFKQYLAVNQNFAESLLKYLLPTDTVWIHDYHLMPLAGMLRRSLPGLTIGFFLHIPFPSYEIFRLLPRNWQKELLEGVMGADLIGFHTIDYASHFLQSVQSALQLDNHRHTIQYNNRLVKVDVFPISIDYGKFNNAYSDPDVCMQRQRIQEKFQTSKIVFSIDRLDYTKGLSNRLKGFELFLENNLKYHNKVVLIVVVIPSRDTIGKYAERKRMIDEMISRINSQHGNLHWQPIIYRYSSIPFPELLALYTSSDVALVTPLRDGMNLIAKEFVASRKDKHGVLVLSEMAGAARELTEAIAVNPNDIKEISRAIYDALSMDPEEQLMRMRTMQERIAAYDVNTWAKDFLDQLRNTKERQSFFRVRFLDDFSASEIVNAYSRSRKRLLLLDYDGTLVPFSALPENAIPNQELSELIAGLCRDDANDVYIISGRDAIFLEKIFPGLNINLIAEHGARIKLKDGGWVSRIMHDHDWQLGITNIMDPYCRRCPMTFVEKKEFSIVWHYRNANQDHAKLRCAELLVELNDFVRDMDLEVLHGNKIIEVRKSGINKGIPVKSLMKMEYDFILAAGDDDTDEDVFRILYNVKNSYTIKVGANASFASYNLLKPSMIISLLQRAYHSGGVRV